MSIHTIIDLDNFIIHNVSKDALSGGRGGVAEQIGSVNRIDIINQKALVSGQNNHKELLLLDVDGFMKSILDLSVSVSND